MCNKKREMFSTYRIQIFLSTRVSSSGFSTTVRLVLGQAKHSLDSKLSTTGAILLACTCT